MNPWKQVALLAKREFRERATSKPFLITMSILVLAILAIGPAVNLFASDEAEATRIGLLGDEPYRRAPDFTTYVQLVGRELKLLPAHLPGFRVDEWPIKFCSGASAVPVKPWFRAEYALNISRNLLPSTSHTQQLSPRSMTTGSGA